MNTGNISQQLIDRETKEELDEAFSLFDVNGSGEINARELKAIMQAFGLDVKKEDIKNYFAQVNRDPTKEKIQKKEFYEIIVPKLGQRDSDEQIKRVFKIFAPDQDHITYKNLEQIAKEVEPELTQEELYEMFDEADLDQDGVINEQEFYQIMKKKGNALDDLSDDDI